MQDEGDVWREESWTAHQGRTAPGFYHLHVSSCVYMDGNHYAGPDCPHDYNGNDPDELEPGWTVLNNRKDN
jgi:hypothetical protein